MLKSLSSTKKNNTSFKQIYAVTIIVIVGFFLGNGISNIHGIYAQNATTTNKITIKLNSAQFIPVANATHDQLKVLITYQTNDASLVDTHINGIMKVYLLNGTLVRTSSFPNGFTVGKSGTIQFATSFTNKVIENVKSDIGLTNLNKTQQLSNTVTTNVTLKNIRK